MLEDAEKKGLLTPGKVSSHCSTTHYRTVLVKIICSVLKGDKATQGELGTPGHQGGA